VEGRREKVEEKREKVEERRGPARRRVLKERATTILGSAGNAKGNGC